MKKTLSVLSFLIICLNLFSQDSAVVYLNKLYELTSKDSAAYICKTVMKKDRMCLTDMNSDGTKIYYCEFSSENPGLPDGLAIFYKNGDSILSTGNYLLGQMTGKWIYYDKGNHPDTVDYSFKNNCVEKKVSKLPEYLFGDNDVKEAGTNIAQSLPSFIRANFHMPARAKFDGVSNIYQVIYCIIDTDGKIKCPQIMNSIHPDIDREIYRILSLYHYQAVVKNPFVIPSVIFGNLSNRDSTDDSNTVYALVEEMPVFPGGDEALWKFIAENLEYPYEAKENGIQGKVIVRFCINKDGMVGQISISKGVEASLNAEAYRVVSILPAFKPGKQKGEPVNVWYSLPITFQLKRGL
jgi:TonB family protein